MENDVNKVLIETMELVAKVADATAVLLERTIGGLRPEQVAETRKDAESLRTKARSLSVTLNKFRQQPQSR